jgi:hypothetical protein
MRRSWPQLKLVALVMLVTVVMHDAVMAGDPHAAPHHSQHAQHSGHTAAPTQDGHSGQRDGATLLPGHHDALQLTHGASPCGLIAAARPPLEADPLPRPADAGAVPPLITEPCSIALPDLAGNPGPALPPRVRRALLQVFLN